MSMPQQGGSMPPTDANEPTILSYPPLRADGNHDITASVRKVHDDAKKDIEERLVPLVKRIQEKEVVAAVIGAANWKRTRMRGAEIAEAIDGYCTQFKEPYIEVLTADWKMVSRQVDIVLDLAMLRLIIAHYLFATQRPGLRPRTIQERSFQACATFEKLHIAISESFEGYKNHSEKQERQGIFDPLLSLWLKARREEWNAIYKDAMGKDMFKNLEKRIDPPCPLP